MITSALTLNSTVYADDNNNTLKVLMTQIDELDALENSKRQEIERLKAQKPDNKCIPFIDNSKVNIHNDFAVTYVISNFVMSVQNGYGDVNAIRENISKAYSLTLVATPAIEKLNQYFNDRLKNEDYIISKVSIDKIITLDKDNLKYKVFFTYYSGIMRDFATPVTEKDLVAKKKSMTISLIKAPTPTVKSKIIENNGIIIPKAEWLFNPFEFWVNDFDISDEK